uniref:Tyr recombinase domain-containing protein n=1 Tax=Caenorhabditis japonica TaxID=281687 RepID=A0A8R1DHW4_CAEJA
MINIVRFAGGARKHLLDRLKELAGDGGRELWTTILNAPELARAGNTVKAYENANKRRLRWLHDTGFPDGEPSLLLYLAHINKTVGSSSMSQAVAAFQMSHNSLQATENALATALVKAKKREEVDVRTPRKEVTKLDILAILETAKEARDVKSERDALIALLSWSALLRSEEAANLRWEDIEQKGDLLEVFVRRAKNDQEARGRRTFVECQQGSDVGILLAKWRVRISGRSIYVFPNLNNNKALSPSAIQSITKSVLLKAGIEDCSHHSLRKGAANELRRNGRSLEEIRNRGRWRSEAGLQRYLVDVPDSQGVDLNNPILPSAKAQEPCADVEPTSGRWSDQHQEMSEAAVEQQNVN